MKTFTVVDQTGKELQVTIEEGRIMFSPMFNLASGGFVSYIDPDFRLYYAPDVVQSVDAVWPQCHRSSHELELMLANILSKARECVLGWDIRDERDRKDQNRVLDICVSRGV